MSVWGSLEENCSQKIQNSAKDIHAKLRYHKTDKLWQSWGWRKQQPIGWTSLEHPGTLRSRACSWGPAEEGGRRRSWADIKSNNPHLTGGEPLESFEKCNHGVSGPEAGNKHARSLWPKCCSGRWGSVNDTEDRFLRAGAERVRTVLSSLLKKKLDDKEKSKNKEKTLHENDLNPDALALEQTREYAERMTKWKRYAFKCSVDVLWGNLIHLMQWCRRPIMHFTHFVRGSIPEAEIIKHATS